MVRSGVRVVICLHGLQSIGMGCADLYYTQVLRLTECFPLSLHVV
jgi:hypothetical protein